MHNTSCIFLHICTRMFNVLPSLILPNWFSCCIPDQQNGFSLGHKSRWHCENFQCNMLLYTKDRLDNSGQKIFMCIFIIFIITYCKSWTIDLMFSGMTFTHTSEIGWIFVNTCGHNGFCESFRSIWVHYHHFCWDVIGTLYFASGLRTAFLMVSLYKKKMIKET